MRPNWNFQGDEAQQGFEMVTLIIIGGTLILLQCLEKIHGVKVLLCNQEYKNDGVNILYFIRVSPNFNPEYALGWLDIKAALITEYWSIAKTFADYEEKKVVLITE